MSKINDEAANAWIVDALWQEGVDIMSSKLNLRVPWTENSGD